MPRQKNATANNNPSFTLTAQDSRHSRHMSVGNRAILPFHRAVSREVPQPNEDHKIITMRLKRTSPVLMQTHICFPRDPIIHMKTVDNEEELEKSEWIKLQGTV